MDTVDDKNVNHPSHYTSYNGIEVIDLTEQMNFNRGNAVKYIARAGLKNPETEIEDLKKAAWYINREIDRLSKNLSHHREDALTWWVFRGLLCDFVVVNVVEERVRRCLTSMNATAAKMLTSEIRRTEMEIVPAEHAAPDRPVYTFAQMADLGMLWWLNQNFFGPQKMLLCFDYAEGSTEPVGWSLRSFDGPVEVELSEERKQEFTRMLTEMKVIARRHGRAPNEIAEDTVQVK